MAALNTTRQPEEKAPLWGGIKERFSQSYGVAKSFASRIKSVLETPVSHVAKNVAHRAGDLVHGVEYALATRINNITKPTPRTREVAAEPQSWGGEFVDDAATLKVIDYHDAKEKLPAIKAARLQREAVALAEEKKAKGAMMTFAAGKIKKEGVPFFTEDISYAKPVGTVLAPTFMDTEYALVSFLTQAETTVGDVYAAIKKHYDRQRELGTLPALSAELEQQRQEREETYQNSGLFASNSVAQKWQYLEQFIQDNGVLLQEHPLLSFIGAKSKNVLWDGNNTVVPVPKFFTSPKALTALVADPKTTVQTLFEALEDHFETQISEKVMPAWSTAKRDTINAHRDRYMNDGVWASNDLWTKWSMVQELFAVFDFDTEHHPLIAYSKEQARRADQEEQHGDLLKAQ